MGTRSDKTSASVAELGYRLLLKLYPGELRDSYEAQMLSLFRDMEQDARSSSGRFARISFVIQAYVDVFVAGHRARQFERARLERTRPPRRSSVMSTWKHDAIVALRFLRKQPGFAFVAAITLALGIGANTAIFSVLYGVLLRPLGLEAPDELAVVRFHRMNDPEDVSGLHPSYLEDLRDGLDASGSPVRLTSYIYESFTLLQRDDVDELGSALAVDGKFFDVMGVKPILGRTFVEDDVLPNRRGNVCVLGEAFWRGKFGGDPDILGRALNLDDEAVVVVGVVPSDIPLPNPNYQIWIPQAWDPEDATLLGRINVIGRLDDREHLERSQTVFSNLASELGAKYPRFEDYTMTLVGFRDTIVGRVRPGIILSAVAVSFILLIACANTANMLLSRAAGRATEIATRQAIGARRGQLASQLIAESLALAVLGGGIGVLAAVGFHRVLLAMAPAYFPRLASVQLDLPVLGFTAAITLVTGLAFGLVPLAFTLKARLGGLGHRGGSRQGWASHALVVGQVTLSVVLLVSAVLMVRSLLLLQQVPLGFRVGGLGGARVYLHEGYPDDPARELYFRSFVERLRDRIEIESAGASSGLPMDPITIDYDLPYSLPGQERTEGDVAQAYIRTVTPGYLETLGIPLKAGRTFDSRDRRDTQGVAVINETFARIAWPGRDPIGESFQIYGGRRELLVVGVVGDVHFAGPAAIYKPEFYVPHAQMTYGAMTVIARAKDADAAARAIREEALALNDRQPVHSSFTMDALVAGTVSTDRFLTWLLVSFATVALLISAAGIYGVISYWVTQSRRELGIRMAFGAGVESIVHFVLRRGLGLSIAGAVLGLSASLMVTRLLSRFLYGVAPNDLLAMGIVVLILGATATFASFLPAWRAAHVDPMSSLRVE